MVAVPFRRCQRAPDLKSRRGGCRPGAWATLSARTRLRSRQRRPFVSVGTAFYPREAELNSQLSWGEWSGYFSAAVYADFHDIEYNAVREAAAVFDISPLYKYVV